MNKKIGIILGAALLVFLLIGASSAGWFDFLGGDEAATDNDDSTLVVGFDAEFPPYGYKDDSGEYVGFDLDLAQEVCDRNNWTLVKQPIDWDAKDSELDSGSIDCIWNGFTINGREKESNTVIDGIYELTNHNLRNYIISRRVDFDITKKFCKQVHYSVYGKSYYAISFENIEGGFEVRNKFCKRTIGKKSISCIKSSMVDSDECCIFEGFFNMLTYETIRRWNMDIGICIHTDCDYIILNSIGNLKVALPYLSKYKIIHCYLDNDESGVNTTKKILNAYPSKVIDESYRYKEYNDLNDVLCGITNKSSK